MSNNNDTAHPVKNLYPFAVLIALVVMSVGCDDSHYLDHIDKESLFAEPVSAEITQIRSEWIGKDLSATSYSVDQLVPIGETGVVLKIVSYQLQGMKQYAALVIPDSEQKMPLRILVNGFDLNNTTNSIRLMIDESFNDKPYAFALPSLRGQSLSLDVNGIKYETQVADGDHCDAFDGAADDVIALLNVIEGTETNIDVQRSAVRGGSRGGTVALLVGERDPRIKAVVAIASPTNMLELTSQNEDDPTYQCQFLRDLVENSVTIADTRKKMLRSSPVFFSDTSPLTQLHLAEDDQIVPVSQGYSFKQRMIDLSLGLSLEFFVYAGRDHSNIALDNAELQQRVETFLSKL